MRKYDFCVSAAGRVNLIGEHVDYCGGKVLPAALSFRNYVCARKNGLNAIRLTWSDLKGEVVLDVNDLGAYKNEKHAKYQAGCAYEWQKAGHPVVGCDLHYHCTVPFGSGLSSSAAIEVSTLAALSYLAGIKPDTVEIALLAQKAENEYAGVNCGIMDQFISANGKKGCALLLDCKTLEHEHVPMELGDYALVIANSNKPHSLVTSKYNERRGETELALSLLKERAEIGCLADLTPELFEKHASCLNETVRRRARHVVEECERVRLCTEAMRGGDIERLGKLLNASHASLKDLYEVTGAELDSLVYAAQSHPACAGARMTGAGFGGCSVNLVKKEGVGDFTAFVGERYERETGYRPSFYEAEISDGIRVEDDLIMG